MSLPFLIYLFISSALACDKDNLSSHQNNNAFVETSIYESFAFEWYITPVFIGSTVRYKQEARII